MIYFIDSEKNVSATNYVKYFWCYLYLPMFVYYKINAPCQVCNDNIVKSIGLEFLFRHNDYKNHNPLFNRTYKNDRLQCYNFVLFITHLNITGLDYTTLIWLKAQLL